MALEKVLLKFEDKAALLFNVCDPWMLTLIWSNFYSDTLSLEPDDTRFDDPGSLAARFLIYVSGGEPYRHKMRIVDPSKEYGQAATFMVHCLGDDVKLGVEEVGSDVAI